MLHIYFMASSNFLNAPEHVTAGFVGAVQAVDPPLVRVIHFI